MKLCGGTLFLSILGCLGAGPLFATSIIQTVVLPGTLSTDPSGATEWLFTDMSTAQFNPALGSLVDVIFTGSANITTTGTVFDENPGSNCVSNPGCPAGGDVYTMTSSTDLHFKLGANPSHPETLPLLNVFDGTGVTQTSPSLYNSGPGPSSYTFPGESYTATGFSEYSVCGTGPITGCLDPGASTGTDPVALDTTPLDLTPLIGTGDVTYTARALNTSSISGPDVFGGVSGTAILTETIEYDYTSMPEPSTMYLGIAAVAIGFGLVRKRARC